MLQYFKQRARKRLLKNTLKNSAKRHTEVHNFGSAKTMGIIVQHKFEVDNNALTRLRKIAKDNKIETKMLVYYPMEKLPDNVISDPGRLLFSNKECNWFGKPEPKEIQDFIDEKFDVLIDFSETDYFATGYAALASKALFKIGRFSYDDNPYDFLITDNKLMSDEEYLNTVESYMEKFKPADQE